MHAEPTNPMNNFLFVNVASIEELPQGERLFLEINQMAIVIFNMAGNLYAVEDRCTHEEVPLGDGDLIGYHIACPRHGARFDVRDGKAVSLPATEDVRTFPVRVVEGQIQIGIARTK